MNLPSRNSQSGTITLLDKGCEFQGKLSFEGVVRIDGVFEGEIFSQDHLIIGEGAMVEASIQVGSLEVGGKVKGKVLARDHLLVHSSGELEGEIQAKQLEVQKGAQINGQLLMKAASERSGFIPIENNLPETQASASHS